MAASRTVRAMGPAVAWWGGRGPGVSWVWEMGMIPVRLIRPMVGLMPTIPQKEAGEMMEPSVSVPTATEQRPAATAAAEPELDPEGWRSSAYGFLVWPPRPLQPLEERLPRKFAHSLRFVLPR